jgi:hypothetical protein
MAARGTVVMLSHDTTDLWSRPSVVSTMTSVDSPRMVVVMGATVTEVRKGPTWDA